MIVAMLASLLLVATAQTPPPEPEPVDAAPSYEDEQQANGYEEEITDDTQAAEDDQQATEPDGEPAPQAAEDSADEAVEHEDLVCRRVHYSDDFGRQRSRKSCRPRSE